MSCRSLSVYLRSHVLFAVLQRSPVRIGNTKTALRTRVSQERASKAFRRASKKLEAISFAAAHQAQRYCVLSLTGRESAFPVLIAFARAAFRFCSAPAVIRHHGVSMVLSTAEART